MTVMKLIVKRLLHIENYLKISVELSLKRAQNYGEKEF